MSPDLADLVAALEPVVRRILREELERCGLRPLPPGAPGGWRYDPERGEWVELAGAAPTSPQAPAGS